MCCFFFFFGQPSTAAVCWLKSCDRIFVMILRLLFRIMRFITMLEGRYLRFQRLVFFMFSLLMCASIFYIIIDNVMLEQKILVAKNRL